MSRTTWLALSLFAIGNVCNADDATLHFSSGNRAVALVELYTSEGCSSCPPADRYLTALKTDRQLWQDFVPVAFHVDYWDYLGWRDRFSRREFSDRQRRYASEGGTRVVYTPGFFANGEEWRNWRKSEVPRSDNTAHGVLAAQVRNSTVTIRWEGVTLVRSPQVHIALLGMALSNDIGAGENRGKRLAHDFVALDIKSVVLADVDGGYEITTTLPTSEVPAKQHALAVWVSDGDRQTPLQATGGYLPPF